MDTSEVVTLTMSRNQLHRFERLAFATHYRILRNGVCTREEAFAELPYELSSEEKELLADAVDGELTHLESLWASQARPVVP